MNAAHFARRFDRRLRRRPYRAVGDGVELPRDELRRIGVCARSTTRAVGSLAGGRHLGQPTTSLCPALRLALRLGALPSDAWQSLLLVCSSLCACLRAV